MHLMVVSVCALSASAEFAELGPLEEHACGLPKPERVDAFDPWNGSWYGLHLYHCCRRVRADRNAAEVSCPRSSESQAWTLEQRKAQSVPDWRETEPYLSADYLDAESGELMTLVNAKLPFERVRDGDMTAWLLRAEHAGVISSGDRRHLMSELRRAREKRELTRGSLL